MEILIRRCKSRTVTVRPLSLRRDLSSYITGGLADYLKGTGSGHVGGAPYLSAGVIGQDQAVTSNHE